VSASLLRFGGFELDRANFQLCRSGRPLRLERIPLEVLLLLVERRGRLVLRQEIAESVWGTQVVLDIDNALNTAIRKVRRALRDDAEHPRYVETVPAKGYRFIGSVTSTPRPEVGGSAETGAPPRRDKVGGSATQVARQTNLPIQSSSLVGRERELAEAGRLIGSHRLLTLTGPGGSGKTRLALQLAVEAVEQFPDGVFWVSLQAFRDPALVEPAIRASVGAADDLVAHVASKRLLVLLDNFEQVLEATPVVSSLLAGTPNAKVLVTSRAPLHLDSERRYPVEPLPEQDAATLFIERASAIAPGFRPTATVGQICRRLDGLPLAIELAAARVALLELDDLLARLERRLPLLMNRSRDAPARQRTLRATIEWSYDLLDPNEQQLFRRVSVFTGSFSLEAAEAVCDTDVDPLESLVERNLVRRGDRGRLGLLDTIREYALERFDESREAEDVRQRHAEFFLGVVERANLNSGNLEVGKPMRHDIAILEQDNVRGALAWAVASGAHALGLAMATSVEWFWAMQDPREGMRWFARLLERPGAESVAPEIRAHALRAYGSSTDIAGDDEAATQLYEQSLALFEQLGDERGRAVLLHRLGIQAMRRREPERARKLIEASHAIHERNDDRWGLTQTIGTLGALARDGGHEDLARELITKSAALAHELAIPWWESGMLAELAQLALTAGRLDEGETRARESLALADQIRDRSGRVFGVGLFARLAVEHGQFERAGRLWGAIVDEDGGAPLGGWRRHRERCEARIREAAGPEFERGYAEGHALTLDDAVSLALAAAD
jgi:predicted ATPase/DNA-binding winged helix-turn-helix (wHTH) protein